MRHQKSNSIQLDNVDGLEKTFIVISAAPTAIPYASHFGAISRAAKSIRQNATREFYREGYCEVSYCTRM